MIHWLFTDPGHAIGALLFHIVLGTLLSMAFLIFGGITAYIAGFFYVLIKAIKKLFINTKNLLYD
jgi:hypothetical protein